jgi:hypothetical protein
MGETMADEAAVRRGYGFWIVAGLVLAPLLYTLSVGPAVYVAMRSGSRPDTLRTIYAPLVWAADNTPLGTPLNWYVQQWEDMAARSVPVAPTAPVPATPPPAPAPPP